ncbi:MAG: phosphoribosylanthranilate isomerase, partial [Bacteroidales bacterium]|jgi:phosphoribosylanthranilate isomerase|nr:phosphoribosylanthranilate isomerase [Bacteroidales bacterium]
LPPDILKVGVFVNATEQGIGDIVKAYRLDLVQLHGNESPEFCRTVRKIRPVIRAISVATAEDIATSADMYQNAADYFLFDTKTSLFGGSGKQFDWSALASYTGNTPFFLSGGIGSDDAKRLQCMQHPLLHAIDINSRFETEPAGRKDAILIKALMHELDKIDN